MMEQQYESWLAAQTKCRSGELLRRLAEGHAYNEALFAKTIWWPAVGSFEHLHAEYEVTSRSGHSYYLDFAYLRDPYKINWEIDDYASHGHHVNRRSFEYERERQNQLVLDGWIVFRLPLDKVKERPHQCQQFLLETMGWFFGIAPGSESTGASLKSIEREIVRLALKSQEPLTPGDISRVIGCSSNTARKWLQQLTAAEWLLSASSGTKRIRSYRLGPKAPRWL